MIALIESQFQEILSLWESRAVAHASRHFHWKDIDLIDQRLASQIKSVNASHLDCKFDFTEFSEPQTLVLKLLCFPATRASLIAEFLNSEVNFALSFQVISWLPLTSTSTLLNALLKNTSNRMSRKLAIDTYRFHRVYPTAALDEFLQEKEDIVLAAWVELFTDVGCDESTIVNEKLQQCKSSTLSISKGYSRQFCNTRLHPLDWLDGLLTAQKLSEDRVVLIFIQLSKQEVTLALNSMIKHGERYSRLMLVGICSAGYLRHIDWLLNFLDDNKLAITALHAICEMLGNLPGELMCFAENDVIEDPLAVSKIEDYRVKFTEWWQHCQSDFDFESRYFLGKKIAQVDMSRLYRDTSQWNRRRIALELAVSSITPSLINHAKSQVVF